MYALLCLQPVKLCLYFGHSVAHNPYNYYTASLVLYGPLEMASAGVRVVGIVEEVQC